jgi:hypothetical protein
MTNNKPANPLDHTAALRFKNLIFEKLALMPKFKLHYFKTNDWPNKSNQSRADGFSRKVETVLSHQWNKRFIRFKPLVNCLICTEFVLFYILLKVDEICANLTNNLS